MNRSLFLAKRIFFFLAALCILNSCDKIGDDVLPVKIQDFRLYPDDIYTFGGLIRLDPLNNDSLKVNVKVTYSQPQHGTLELDQDGSMLYLSDVDFLGTDSLEYTVCSAQLCKSEKIRLYVESPPDPETCVTSLGADSLETTKNTPKGIRIFMNDIICPMSGTSVFAPEKGTFKTIDYSGSYKNTTYVYYPPKDFVGEDSFRYRIHPDPSDFYGNYIEMVVKVTVK